MAELFAELHENLAELVESRAVGSTAPVEIGCGVLGELFVACEQQTVTKLSVSLEFSSHGADHDFDFRGFPIAAKFVLRAATKTFGVARSPSETDLLFVFGSGEFLSLVVVLDGCPVLSIKLKAVRRKVAEVTVFIDAGVEVDRHREEERGRNEDDRPTLIGLIASSAKPDQLTFTQQKYRDDNPKQSAREKRKLLKWMSGEVDREVKGSEIEPRDGVGYQKFDSDDVAK